MICLHRKDHPKDHEKKIHRKVHGILEASIASYYYIKKDNYSFKIWTIVTSTEQIENLLIYRTKQTIIDRAENNPSCNNIFLTSVALMLTQSNLSKTLAMIYSLTFKLTTSLD